VILVIDMMYMKAYSIFRNRLFNFYKKYSVDIRVIRVIRVLSQKLGLFCFYAQPHGQHIKRQTRDDVFIIFEGAEKSG